MTKKQTDEVMDLPAEFGGFSVRDIARIAVRVTKAAMTPTQADKLLAGTCVEAVLVEDPNASKDTPGQQTIPGVQGLKLSVTADILRYSGCPKSWGFSLSVTPSSVDVGAFAHIAGKSGRLELTLVGPARKKQKAGGDDDDEDEES